MDFNRDEIGAVPLLGQRDEIELARQIEAGVLARAAREAGQGPVRASRAELIEIERQGSRAWDRYIRANLRLVAKVVATDAGRTGIGESELFQEGCVALMMAVQRFDAGRGYRFATYALPWIRAYVAAATATRCGEVNLPIHRAVELRQIRNLQTELAQSLGRMPTTAEVATGAGRSTSWVRDLLSFRPPQPLDAGSDVTDRQAGADFGAVERSAELGPELLQSLGSLERRVLQIRYGYVDGLPHTLAESARFLGLTVTQTRRAEARALVRLRHICPSNALSGLA